MKAILRRSAAALSLLLFAAVSNAQGRIWISPVFKTPLPIAPSPSNSGFFLVDAYGRLTGPHYYLVPPCPPFNGMLPGPIGQAIMAGNLPHDLLMKKDAQTIGDAPLLGRRAKPPEPGTPQGPGHGSPPRAGYGAMPYPFAQNAPNPNTQVPYYAPPYYASPMPRPMMPYAPYPVAYAPGSSYGQPIAYLPYYGPPGMVATAQRNPRTGIWQVQNVMPGQAGNPFAPIPNFNPRMPSGMPMQSGPMGPMTAPTGPVGPMGPMGPMTSFQNFGPIQQFTPFTPIQGPQAPQLEWQGMQLPRMETQGPPPQHPGPMYPVHPFTRSPRDFFMWGESMDDERARASRPFPVP